MAGKKKEGIGSLKSTTGGLRREDRLANAKNVFETISIDAKNALTVMYMLQSPEEKVVLKAVASLESHGQRDKENLRLLTSLGIFQYILPLVHSKNTVVKRFSQKLIAMLCSLEEFRDQMFTVRDILNTFVDILEKEPDMVMHEFAALTLAELTSECEAASNLLKVENSIPTLFLRITSPDPDVQKNCLDVMNHLLNDMLGVEAFIESPGFDILKILNLTSSNYPVIQLLAIEILNQLISWRRDTRPLFAFRDASGIETTLEIMEKEEWLDLHTGALELIIQVVDSPELCDYLLQTGCLLRMVDLLDTVEAGPPMEKILEVLARMCQTQKGRMALHKVDMVKRFRSYLNAKVEAVLESSCLGIAHMAQYGPCLDSIMEENPIPSLLGILINDENSLSLRNLAAYALNILAIEDRRGAEGISKSEKFEFLTEILVNNQKFPVEFCKNVIQIYTGISSYDFLRVEAINDSIMDALMSCIQQADGDPPAKDSSLQVDALECISAYLVESKARSIFNSLDGARKLIGCMKSKYASVREWAGQLVILASQNKEFVKSFIKNEGLHWLIEQKSTRYSMPSWESAIEAIFDAFLPAKFAFTGRLDFQDITEEGFYVLSRSCLKFFVLEEYLENFITPICPVYVANFEISPLMGENESVEAISAGNISEPKSQHQSPNRPTEMQNLSKYMKGSDRNSGEVYKWTGSLNTYSSVDYEENFSMKKRSSQSFSYFLPDPYLSEYLENLKKKIAIEEFEFGDANWFFIHPKLVRERVRIIAELVAEEMSGFEPNALSLVHHKEKYINEMKFQLGTTIFPLGYVRIGDYLERAMLFKVLSDRIGFPCALVRGSYGRAWIEITLPVLNIEEPGENASSAKETGPSLGTKSDSKLSDEFSRSTFATEREMLSFSSTIGDENFWFPKIQMECFKAFPNHFLKPNAVVDLINTPGRIMKLNSREAEEYCGNFLFAKD